MTPAELCAKLLVFGHDVTERMLIEWRRKRLLPRLERMSGRRAGRGAIYGWTDPDILLQAHTLCVFLERHRRTEVAHLSTWFAGFRYDEDEVRTIWRAVTENSWRSSLESLTGEPFGDEDLEWVLAALPVPVGRGAALNNAMLRARLVPDFDCAQIDELPKAFDELCARTPAAGREQLRTLVGPEYLERLLRLYNQEFAPVAWKERIKRCSLSDLRQVHGDLQFIFEIYRWILRRVIADVLENGAQRRRALCMLPIGMSGLGWLLIMLDLSLRANGMDEEVQATADLFKRPSIQFFAHTVVASAQEIFSRGDLDNELFPTYFTETLNARVSGQPELDEVRNDVGEIGDALVGIWQQRCAKFLSSLGLLGAEF
jgi:hypothetical protein